jgi:hypothetical protein
MLSTPATNPSLASVPATTPAALTTSVPATQPTIAGATMPSQNQAQNYQGQYYQGQNGQNGQQNFGYRNGRNRRGYGGNYANNGATQPSDLVDIPPTAAMPIAYDVVSGRNIFVKGSQTAYTGENIGNGDQGISRPLPRPLVLDGATDTNGAMVAYIEDTANADVREFKVGDTVAGNKITRIGIGEIDIQAANGQTTTIYAGQTLTGESAFNTLYMSPVLSAPAAVVMPTTLPSGDDIIARMQRRRLLELQATTNPSIRVQ